MAEDKSSGQDGAIAEFTALREEIIARHNNQQSLLSIQLTAAGALFSLALSGADKAAVLLVLPLVTYLLAGRHVAHSYACHSIAAYISTELSGRVRGGLGWETWLQPRRSSPRRYPVLNPLSISFPGISVLALLGSLPFLASLSMSGTTVILWTAWLMGVILTISSLRLVWKIRSDSFMWAGPVLGRENDA